MNPAFDSLFQFYTEEELEKEKKNRLQEIDASLALTLRALIEASFRIDYFQRCNSRKEDLLSTNFRVLYENKDKMCHSKLNFLEDGRSTAMSHKDYWRT